MLLANYVSSDIIPRLNLLRQTVMYGLCGTEIKFILHTFFLPRLVQVKIWAFTVLFYRELTSVDLQEIFLWNYDNLGGTQQLPTFLAQHKSINISSSRDLIQFIKKLNQNIIKNNGSEVSVILKIRFGNTKGEFSKIL